MGVVVGLGKNAEIDLEVERLDQAALHLGLTGVVGDRYQLPLLPGLKQRLDG